MIRRFKAWLARRPLRKIVMGHFDAAQALHIQAKADALSLHALQQVVTAINANPHPAFEFVPFSAQPMEIKDFPPPGPERTAFIKKCAAARKRAINPEAANIVYPSFERKDHVKRSKQ